MGHIAGQERVQVELFAHSLDELIDPASMARVIDAWVAQLDLRALSFVRACPAATGRPGYDPGDMLRLYMYGYLAQVRSSRRLERECARNVELMWLLGRLKPDFKTIAQFRRSNADALVAVCAAFVQFARSQQLIDGELVAIDGSRIRAVASKKALVSVVRAQKQEAALSQQIQHYLAQLEAADAQEQAQQQALPQASALAVDQAIEQLQRKRAKVQQDIARLRDAGKTYEVRSEPEARTFKTEQSTATVGYNLQSAVDAQHHLIVHHEVCQDLDVEHLLGMARAAQYALKQKRLTVTADKGYFSAEQLAQCEQHGITPYVAMQHYVNSHGQGTLYEKSAFAYDPASDTFSCPAGQTMKRFKRKIPQRRINYRPAKPGACATCAQKPQCTQGQFRIVSRHFDEDSIQRCAQRMRDHPHMVQLRSSVVEHPFGTIKTQILGNARLLMRGLRGAKAELSLAVLAYNFKRVSNILGNRQMHQVLAR
jgi:transposase